MNEETCPQCSNSLSGYASRLVQDSCGHKKCRKCLLVDENGCKTCDVNRKLLTSNSPEIINNENKNTSSPPPVSSILEQCLVKSEFKQNTNVIRFHQNETVNNYQHVSVLKSSTNLLDSSVNRTESDKKQTDNEKTTKVGKPAKELKKVEKRLKCDECGQKFRIRSHLVWHIRRHTGERPFACQICTKTYTQLSKLNEHLVLHSGERPYKCKECNRTFQYRGSLRSHSRTHSGEKPYSCKQCSAKFAEKANLDKHNTTHTKEKPFLCSDCGSTFSLKWHLTAHLRTHSRERPYTCTQCPRAFNNTKDLHRHQIVHTLLKPFSCIICNTHFRRKDSLDRHLKNTHPEEAVQKKQKKTGSLKVTEKTEIKADLLKKPETVIRNLSEITKANILENKSPDIDAKLPILRTNAVSVINGPVKLSCKTKDFKDNYKIARAEPEPIETHENIDNVDIYKCILSSPMVNSERSQATIIDQPPIRSADTLIKTIPDTSDIIKCQLSAPITVPRIHYETSFESGQHAIIKNIKFKLPPDYTPTLSKFNSLQRDNFIKATYEKDCAKISSQQQNHGNSLIKLPKINLSKTETEKEELKSFTPSSVPNVPNIQDDIIKNIKFKLPTRVTPVKVDSAAANDLDKDGPKVYTPLVPVQFSARTLVQDKMNCVRTITKVPPVIPETTSHVDVQHWRKQITSQIYSPD